MEEKFEWSKYQQAIFDEVVNGSGNMVVNALAGSAKTTSLIEAANRVHEDKKVLLCAFNKRIKEELESRSLNANIKCSTLHSLGFAACRKAEPFVQVDANKVDDIINSMRFNIPSDSYSKIMSGLKQSVSLSKALLVDTPSKIKEVVEEYDIDYTPYGLDEFVGMVFKVLDKSKSITKVIDFDDQVYHPVIFQYQVEKFDSIFIDEFQDLNKNQMSLAFMAKKKDARIHVFLDILQAIYAFRAASPKHVKETIASLNAKEYSLPICYRCPNKVIELAKEFAPNIESPPGNKDGEIHNVLPNQVYSLAKPGDFILSRKNAPLITYALNFLKQGTPANISGRDIALQLVNVVKKTKSKTIDSFNLKIEDMRSKEISKATKEKKFHLIEAINDKYDCLAVLSEACKTPAEISKKINSMFVDVSDNKVVLMSSVHRAKGLERNNVFIIKNTFSFVDDSEKAIYYVAITRAKNKLYFIEKEEKKEKDKKKPKS